MTRDLYPHMRAMVLPAPVPIEDQPLRLVEKTEPVAGPGELLVRVRACGVCRFCRSGRENLCLNALFTGWDHDGGDAEYAVVHEDFAYALPSAIPDEAAAPLLCAGIIGFRAIKRAGIAPGATVGLFGFGGSAHLAIQVLKHWKCCVFVMSRGGVHRGLAEELGADWIGGALEPPQRHRQHA